MSYTVMIAGSSLSYTYNLSRLFYAHIPGGRGLRTLDGLTGRQALGPIGAFFRSAQAEALSLWTEDTVGDFRFLHRYDAPNGWGSTVGAILFMGIVQSACTEHPRCKLRVW